MHLRESNLKPHRLLQPKNYTKTRKNSGEKQRRQVRVKRTEHTRYKVEIFNYD